MYVYTNPVCTSLQIALFTPPEKCPVVSVQPDAGPVDTHFGRNSLWTEYGRLWSFSNREDSLLCYCCCCSNSQSRIESNRRWLFFRKVNTQHTTSNRAKLLGLAAGWKRSVVCGEPTDRATEDHQHRWERVHCTHKYRCEKRRKSIRRRRSTTSAVPVASQPEAREQKKNEPKNVSQGSTSIDPIGKTAFSHRKFDSSPWKTIAITTAHV